MLKALVTAVLVILVVVNFSQAIWITAKAELAQILIRQAWAETLKTGLANKPWSWADTWPIARLKHPATNTDLYVLAGSTGNALAFGPGHQHSTARPGEGSSLIGGHRDTHFRFLKEAQLKDELLIQGMDGQWLEYRIQQMEVRDSRTQALELDPTSKDIYLVTCYPFESLVPGGPLRYLAIASPLI